jgi:hypothetical protein
MNIRVVIVGLGPIGAAVARQVVERKGFQLVGAVDIDPQKVGRDVAEVLGLARPLRIKVTHEIGKTLRPDAAGGGALHQFVVEIRCHAIRGSDQASRADRDDN